MKKSILALSSVAVLFSSMAFAHPPHGKPHHNPEFHKAMDECLAQAGVQKPEFKETDGKPAYAKKGERPEIKEGQAKESQAKEGQGKPFHKRGNHPKLELTNAQKSQLDTCLTQKGFEKPAKSEHKPEQKPTTKKTS